MKIITQTPRSSSSTRDRVQRFWNAIIPVKGHQNNNTYQWNIWREIFNFSKTTVYVLLLQRLLSFEDRVCNVAKLTTEFVAIIGCEMMMMIYKHVHVNLSLSLLLVSIVRILTYAQQIVPHTLHTTNPYFIL